MNQNHTHNRPLRLLLMLLLSLCCGLFLLPADRPSAASHRVVMTAEEFIAALKRAAARKTTYISAYPYNLGYYDGNVISWDCSNFGKSIIYTKGAIVDNWTVGNFSPVDTSCGLGDWNSDGIHANLLSAFSTDFSALVPGEWLWMSGHIGYYIGDGQVIECTLGWGVNGVTQSQVDAAGRRTRNGVQSGSWAAHAKVPWIDYSGVVGSTADRVPVGVLDFAEGREGAVWVRGWAYDPDETWKSVEVHIYVDGVFASSCTADRPRPDVDSAYGCGSAHGFDHTFSWETGDGGTHTVAVYMLNTRADGAPGQAANSPASVRFAGQAPEWQEIGGEWYYGRTGGPYATGWQKIGGRWYYFNASGVMQTYWQQVDGAWYYFGGGGAMVTGLRTIGSQTYYLKPGGDMATGWQKIDGHWYYFASSGAMVRSGWRLIDGKWYYFKDSGEMAFGWIRVGDTWYYLGATGAMATGWQKIGGKTYYFTGSGAMAADEWRQGWKLDADGAWTYPYQASWKKDSKGWLYGDTGGWFAKNTTITIDGKVYTFDAQGYWIE
ncbi:MAG: N-acetylmuramoyl-L-alanine amidase family protein [Lachnospiraceae bacterium]|nr:N-acetylmuramoyl-L-alanine amidase family protein [Lachnospiraceae bacterium]